MKPRALREGAHIRVVSPSSPVAREKLSNGLAILEGEGYRVSFGRHAFDSWNYLAGRDEDRAADLMEGFTDETVDAVYCARGGYGCARLMPFLDLDRMARSRKMFLGFSDITTLHLALNRRGLPTVHAPMTLTFIRERKPWVAQSLLNVFKGNSERPKGATKGKTLVPGVAEGVVTGGCLCLLTDSIGTPDAIDFEGKIVLIEDVDEQPHRVDAMLTQLILVGAIQKAAGIVVGEMTRTDRRFDRGIGRRPWREIVQDRLSPLGIPTILDYPFGHGRNMLSLPLGIRARLDADRGVLTYTENLCES